MRCELLLAGCLLCQFSVSPATTFPRSSRPEVVGFRESSQVSPSFTASRALKSHDLSSLLSEFEPVELHVTEVKDGPFDDLRPRDLREERHHRRLLRQQRRRLDREEQHEEYFTLYSIFQNAFESLRSAGRLLSQYIEPSFGFTERSTHTVRNLVVRFQAPEVVRRRKTTRAMRLTDSYLAESALLGHSAPSIQPEEASVPQPSRDETTTIRAVDETTDGHGSTTEATTETSTESSSTIAPEDTTDPPSMAENEVQAYDYIPAAEWAKFQPQRSDQEKDDKPLPANILAKTLKPIDLYAPELLTNELKKKKK